ncbi:MAG: PAS domain S-box protein [Polyangiaceae bacterium]
MPSTSPTLPSLRPPPDDLQTAYLRRIAHQLDLQTSSGANLSRQVSLQATALSVLNSISESLAREFDPESALGDVLAGCLDAAGLSVGCIFLRGNDGELHVKTQVGAPTLERLGMHERLLAIAAGTDALLVPSDDAGPEGASMLASLGVASALFVPIVAREDSLGLLMLASNQGDLADSTGEAFVRAARSVSRQLGQSLALSSAFSKLTATEQRYRALLESAGEAIAVLTPDGHSLEVNRSCERIFRTAAQAAARQALGRPGGAEPARRWRRAGRPGRARARG